MKRKILFIAVLVGTVLSLGTAQPGVKQYRQAPPFLDGATPWADSVFSSLSLDQRIAQLMMVAVYSDKDAKHEKGIEDMVRESQHRRAHLLQRRSASAGETHQPVPSSGDNALAHRHGPGVGLGHALG
jgi:hypothetical protein